MKKIHKYHYFYKITNNINNRFYYGVHNTNDLEDGYMGSGKRLHYAYKKYGIENFTKEILKFFDTQTEAFEYESQIVTEQLIKDENCYNVKLGGTGWCTSGLLPVKDTYGNKFIVAVDDERIKIGELIPLSKGNVVLKCVKDGSFKCIKNDENVDTYLNNGFQYLGTNKVSVKDKKGNFYSVSLNDERYLSGELVPVWKDRKHSKETREKMCLTHKSNKDQQGEKNSQYGTCWVYNENGNIKIKKEELQEYLNNGYIKGRKLKMPNDKISHLDMDIINKYQEEGFTNLEICKKLNISEYILYKFFKRQKQTRAIV